MLSRSSGRFMVGCRKGVNTLAGVTRKNLSFLPIYRGRISHALATDGPILLSEAQDLASGRV